MFDINVPPFRGVSAAGVHQLDRERWDHATIQPGLPHGALRRPSLTHGQAPLLPRVWLLLHSSKCEEEQMFETFGLFVAS